MIHYRLAQREDAAIIQQLLQELAASLGESDIYRGNQEALERHGFGEDPCFEVLLAFLEGRPVGLCLYFREFSTWRGEPGVYVQDLYVHPDLRGQSVGRSLLHRVASRSALLWHCHYLRLSVHDNNHDARFFYQRLGLVSDSDTDIMKLLGAAFRNLADIP